MKTQEQQGYAPPMPTVVKRFVKRHNSMEITDMLGMVNIAEEGETVESIVPTVSGKPTATRNLFYIEEGQAGILIAQIGQEVDNEALSMINFAYGTKCLYYARQS